MKRTPLRRKRKGEDALLTQKLDKAWSVVVRTRARWRCEVCGKQEGVLHAHHIVSRGRHALRHDIRNGVALCYVDHFCLAHGDVVKQQIWRAWLVHHRGADLKYVIDHAEDDGKTTIPQKRDKLAELEAQIAELRDEAA
jgi:ribosomal protein S14